MLALLGGRVIAEPRAPATAATVLVDGDRIAAVGSAVDVPPNAERIDCSNCTIVAGFWNSHVHFFERKWANALELPAGELDAQLADFLRFGFTTVFDLSSDFKNTGDIRARIRSGEVRGPRIFTTGEGIVPAGFAFPDYAYALLGQTKASLFQVRTPDDAREAADELLARSVDAIKFFASTPGAAALSAESMIAAVATAHGAGVPVFVHPNTPEDVARSIEAGVDIVAHTTPRGGNWSQSLLHAMRDADAALVPTLALWQYLARHDRVSVAQQQIENATSQLREWHDCGGEILFGTDAGAIDPDPGPEYLLMREAGLGFDELLTSLTTAPATRFGLVDSLGKVRSGFQADLTVLRGDPSRDAAALSSVQCVVRAGEIVFRQSAITGS